MTKWEYLVSQDSHEIHGVGRLDTLGAEGWELVGFDGRGVAFFKRPLPEAKAASAPKRAKRPAGATA